MAERFFAKKFSLSSVDGECSFIGWCALLTFINIYPHLNPKGRERVKTGVLKKGEIYIYKVECGASETGICSCKSFIRFVRGFASITGCTMGHPPPFLLFLYVWLRVFKKTLSRGFCLLNFPIASLPSFFSFCRVFTRDDLGSRNLPPLDSTKKFLLKIFKSQS